MNHILPLRDFLHEQEVSERPYKVVCFYQSDKSRDVVEKEHLDMMKNFEKSGMDFEYFDYTGTYIIEEGDKVFLHGFPIDEKTKEYVQADKDGKTVYRKPVELDRDNTLILYRDLPSGGNNFRRNWTDMIEALDAKGFFLLNPFECYRLCSSKFMTDVVLRQNDILTPKTTRITHSEDAERAFKELDTKFPVILKASVGTQTGIGVVLIDNLRTLHTTVQMMMLFDKTIPLIIQEYIPIDYDIRAMVLGDEVIASMKRNVMKNNDFRSNVSIGAVPEKIELTDLEKETAIRASKSVKGILTGVDLLPSNDREKEPPYVLEVNATAGLTGIEKVVSGTTKKIFDHFKNRDTWT